MFRVNSVDNVQFGLSVISDIFKPPFVRLPDPTRVLIRRAERLRELAEGCSSSRGVSNRFLFGY